MSFFNKLFHFKKKSTRKEVNKQNAVKKEVPKNEVAKTKVVEKKVARKEIIKTQALEQEEPTEKEASLMEDTQQEAAEKEGTQSEVSPTEVIRRNVAKRERLVKKQLREDEEATKNKINRNEVASPEQWQRPIALESSVLNEIPVEILLHILDFLSTSSAAAFSISCMEIKHRLGDQYLRALAKVPTEKLAFLNLLAFNMPDQIACPPCKRLHHLSNAARYTTEASTASVLQPHRECLAIDFSQPHMNVQLYIGDHFSATGFRMAMKRHQQDPECKQILKLLSFDKRFPLDGRYWKRVKVNCGVSQGSMVHRQQMVIYPVDISKYPLTPYVPIESVGFVEICQHLDFIKEENTQLAYIRLSLWRDWDAVPFSTSDLGKVWSAQWPLLGSKYENTTSGWMKCPHCLTVFRIEFKYYPGHGTVMFFTRYKFLGTGPEDEDWKRHLQPRKSSLLPKRVQFDEEDYSSIFGEGNLKDDFLLEPDLSTGLFHNSSNWLSSYHINYQWLD